MRARTLRPPLPSRPSWWLEEARTHGGAEVSPPLDGRARGGRRDRRRWLHRALDGARAPGARPLALRGAPRGTRDRRLGPSGRNGGFLHGYWSSLPTLRPLIGDGAALAARARVRPHRARGASVLRERAARTSGCARVAAEGLGARRRRTRRVERAVEAAAALGVAEEARRCSTRRGRERLRLAALSQRRFFRDGATVQPARLARALRRAALADGVAAPRAHTRHRHPSRRPACSRRRTAASGPARSCSR